MSNTVEGIEYECIFCELKTKERDDLDLYFGYLFCKENCLICATICFFSKSEIERHIIYGKLRKVRFKERDTYLTGAPKNLCEENASDASDAIRERKCREDVEEIIEKDHGC